MSDTQILLTANLVVKGGETKLCRGVVLYSRPPQFGGPCIPVADLDVDAVEGLRRFEPTTPEGVARWGSLYAWASLVTFRGRIIDGVFHAEEQLPTPLVRRPPLWDPPGEQTFVAGGFHYLMVLADGEPADPGVFASMEPPGHWKAGDVARIRPGIEFRILDVQAATEGENGAPWASDYNAVWTVEACS